MNLKNMGSHHPALQMKTSKTNVSNIFEGITVIRIYFLSIKSLSSSS